MAKYAEKSQDKVAENMREMKKGELKSGRSGKTVTNPKQAIAIGLSEARKEGARVPGKAGAGKAAKKAAPKKAAKKRVAKKTARKRAAAR